jgi:putative endonuclease
VQQPTFVNSNQSVGKYGEDRAAEFLLRLGYEILERNWRGKTGEIDIVARDRNCLVFAEVKTRTRTGFGHPFEAITAKKIQTMRSLVSQWCQSRNLTSNEVRLDALSVLIISGRVTIEHLKQVF